MNRRSPPLQRISQVRAGSRFPRMRGPDPWRHRAVEKQCLGQLDAQHVGGVPPHLLHEWVSLASHSRHLSPRLRTDGSTEMIPFHMRSSYTDSMRSTRRRDGLAQRRLTQTYLEVVQVRRSSPLGYAPGGVSSRQCGQLDRPPLR